MKRYVPLAVFIAVLAIAAAALALNFTSRMSQVSGVSVGEVVLGDRVPIRLRYSSGGLDPAERASVMARRLSAIENLTPSDINVARSGRYWTVVARGQLIATADQSHALANNTSQYGLAVMWRNQLRSAIAAETGIAPPAPVGTGPAPLPAQVVKTSQKTVPIISVGSGLRVGVAVVAGSDVQVDKVNAVAQIEGQFGDRVRVRALVPIDTENVIGNLRRVPGTAVIGVADIRL